MEDSVSSGIICGKIEAINDFFQKYKSKDEYYSGGNSEGFAILEGKLHRHYLKTDGIKINYEIYETLKAENVLDREGTSQFETADNLEGADFATISKAFGCDKSIDHRYEYPYDTYLKKFRDKTCTIFEIGIDAGKSLKVWENFLPKAKIYGMDIGVELKYERGEVFKADQSNLDDLTRIKNQIGKCEIIIDDGSHVIDHQLKSFYYLFENMLDWGGVYVIEDIECSYWNPNSTIYGYAVGEENIIDHFVKLNHSVNNNYSNHTNDLHIKSISYYPNCIVIEKYTKDEIRSEEYRFKHLL